jgi:DNA-binding winged helix-turn-helix (wHTH) protein
MDNNKVTLNDLVLELDTCTLRSTTSSYQVSLSYSECLILNLLYKESPKTIKRDVLLEKCWPGKIVTNSSLNVAIKNLRNALMTFDAPFKVVTVQKEGYCIPAFDSLASIPTMEESETKAKTSTQSDLNSKDACEPLTSPESAMFGLTGAQLIKGALGSLIALGLSITFYQMAFFMSDETIAGIEVVHDDIKIVSKDEALFNKLSNLGVTRLYLHDRGVGCNNIQAVALIDGKWTDISPEFSSLSCREES